MARRSPTARTLDYLLAHGWEADIVERRVGPITRDWRGFADVLALKAGEPALLVQCTGGDGGNHAARVRKALALDSLPGLLATGAQCEVWSWRYSRRTKDWVLRRQRLTVADLTTEGA